MINEIKPIYLLLIIISLHSQIAVGNEILNGKFLAKYEGCNFDCLRIKANKDIETQIVLGKMYENGEGVKQNDAEAYMWYKKAANQGSADAMYQLGRMTEQGKYVYPESLEEKAMVWYQKAADHAHKGALELLEILKELISNY